MKPKADPLKWLEPLFKLSVGDDAARRFVESGEWGMAIAPLAELGAKELVRSIGLNPRDDCPKLLDALPLMDSWEKVEASFGEFSEADKAEIGSYLKKLKVPARELRKSCLALANTLPHQSGGGHPRSAAAREPTRVYEAVKQRLDREESDRIPAYKDVAREFGTGYRTIQGIFLSEEKRLKKLESSSRLEQFSQGEN